jgi:DivIVA domain-containing protein
MIWFFAILIVLALGGVAVVAAGRGQPLAPAYDDAPDSLVPSEGPVTADDLRRIRFPLAVRGYRMAEVDALLERLAEEREAADLLDAEAAAPVVVPPAAAPVAPPVESPAVPLEATPGSAAGPETSGDTDPSASAH